MEQNILLLILFGLFVRVIGVSISLENLLISSFQKSRYLAFSLGWILQFASGVCLLVLESNGLNQDWSDFLVLCNIIFHAMSDIYLLSGFIDFIEPIQVRISTLIAFSSIFFHIMFFFLGGLGLSKLFESLSLLILTIFVFLGGYYKRKKIGILIGKDSVWLLFPTILVMGYSIIYISNLLIYKSELPNIVVDWFITVILIFTVILMVYFENKLISSSKDILKDQYSHDLGNILQVILTSQNLIAEYGDKNSPETLLIWKTKLERKWKEARQLLDEIRKI